MRDPRGLNLRQCLPRMSWDYRNLFNLWRRSEEGFENHRPPFGDSRRIDFRHTRASMFQQRWKSKALVRGYHGDHIPEKIFKRWYLPDTLPDVRPRQTVLAALAGDDKGQLGRFAGRREAREIKERKRLEEEERKGMAPVGSLMFMEVERRIDVFLFRCCFAHSVYEARRMVVHGNVMLNGKKHGNANTRLAPGDMVSVDPTAIRLIEAPKNSQSQLPSEAVESTESSETAPTPSPSAKQGSETPLTKLLARPSPSGAPYTPFNLPPYASPFLFIPAYIEVSFQTCSAIYVRHPTARPGYSEIPTPFEADGEIVRLAWEWYAKCRPRMRSKKQVSRMPENRKSLEERVARLI